MLYYNEDIIANLTDKEINEAYYYQKQNHDMEDVINYIQFNYNGKYNKVQRHADRKCLNNVVERYQNINFDQEDIACALEDTLVYRECTPSDEATRIDRIAFSDDRAIWTYYNQDGCDGEGQFVEILVTREDYKAALDAKHLAEDENRSGISAFTDYLYTNCDTCLIDKGTQRFDNYDKFFVEDDEGEKIIRNTNPEKLFRALRTSFSPETQKRLFVDMDGTLARFHDEVQYLERMFEKDFFRNLKPFEEIVEGIKTFKDNNPDVEVFILSAAVSGEPPYCRAEKHAWLDEHLPCIDRDHRIFTRVGEPKSKYIPGGISLNDFLLDDYNVGLEQWVADGGRAIKAKNNINHKGLNGELWRGSLVDILQPPQDICDALERELLSPPKKEVKKSYARTL